jgi:hypothetical protein
MRSDQRQMYFSRFMLCHGYYCTTIAHPSWHAGRRTYRTISGTVSVTAMDSSPVDAACPNDSLSWAFSPAPGEDASVPPGAGAGPA